MLTVAAVAIAYNALGHVLSAVAPSPAVGGVFMGLFVSMFSLFCGFLIVSAAVAVSESGRLRACRLH